MILFKTDIVSILVSDLSSLSYLGEEIFHVSVLGLVQGLGGDDHHHRVGGLVLQDELWRLVVHVRQTENH